MENYKLIALDMDGTLLTNSNKIAPSTLKALQEAYDSGISVTISTGRSLQGIEEYRQQLPLSVPLITYNGAMVVATDGTILFQKNLEETDALAILNFKRNPETRLIFWCENKLYVDKDTPETRAYAKLSNADFTVFDNALSYAKKGITKILWIDEPSRHTSYKDILHKETFSNVTYCVSKPEFLEFFHKDVSKGTALTFLADYLSLKKENTLAFGDGDNDIPLLQAAGFGIAMGNGSDSLKEIAHYITASNEDNGIASALSFLSKNQE